MVKKTFKVVGMHCTSCPLLIESDLGDAGIKASCNYARQILEVEYDDTKFDEQKIRGLVQSAGYDLDVI